MNKTPADAGIPILTEVIPNLPVLTEVIAPPPRVPAAAPPTASAEPAQHVQPLPSDDAPVPAPEPAASDAEKWERLEREVREQVLQQLLDRIDFVLEQRVRDSLADVLQTAVDRLADEIRGGLQQSLRDVVGRAVAQEISRLQATRK